jgi:hypothetical protein
MNYIITTSDIIYDKSIFHKNIVGNAGELLIITVVGIKVLYRKPEGS